MTIDANASDVQVGDKVSVTFEDALENISMVVDQIGEKFGSYLSFIGDATDETGPMEVVLSKHHKVVIDRTDKKEDRQ